MRRFYIFLSILLLLYQLPLFSQPETRGQTELADPPEIRADAELFLDRLRVELVAGIPNLEIRFTCDGTEPTDTSFVYTEPLEIRGAVTVKACCYRDGKQVSETATRSFTMVLPYAAKYVANPVSGIRYQYFSGDMDSLPDLSGLTPEKTGILPCFTFDPPAGQNRFGIVYTGYILVPERNVYTFSIESTQANILCIGNKRVVGDGGLDNPEPQEEGTIGLAKGFHRIRIISQNKTGIPDLKVFVKSHTLEKQPLPQEWLFIDHTGEN